MLILFTASTEKGYLHNKDVLGFLSVNWETRGIVWDFNHWPFMCSIFPSKTQNNLFISQIGYNERNGTFLICSSFSLVCYNCEHFCDHLGPKLVTFCVRYSNEFVIIVNLFTEFDCK